MPTLPDSAAPRATAVAEAPPYFDVLFTRLQREPEMRRAFGRHVHWGYWPDPEAADGSGDDYALAAEALCRRICDAASITDGQRILDVGCGFGGTIASLNERQDNLRMVGVNIDARQLERAAATIQPDRGNRIQFQQGDACDLQFPADSFDVVLAVECIFHFPSRSAFFEGAARALRPGGLLTLSDFVPREDAVRMLRSFDTGSDDATRRTWGHIDVICPLSQYEQMAEQVGLTLVGEDDITENTLPTYTFLRKHMRSWPDPAEAATFDKATAQLELVSRAKLLGYKILTFRRS
jgi:cyclopropane fatty-acyl-phospholipid synthase-like methyltransferase